MSIISTKTASDPHGPLAWTASVAVIALEKLDVAIQGIGTTGDLDLELDDEEREALSVVTEEMSLLSEASKISGRDLFAPGSDRVRSDLRESFSTLVAIESDFSSPPSTYDFRKTADELRLIMRQEATGSLTGLSREVIKKAQAACLELLEHLDNNRPTLALH
jgi:hypothetical protein